MVSNSEQETYSFAKKLAESLPTPAHVLLYGELGAGKTVFAKGLADGFGVNEADEVTSPTFTLINQYSGRVRIYHIDLYRIETGALDGLGLEEIFDDWRTRVCGNDPCRNRNGCRILRGPRCDDEKVHHRRQETHRDT